MTRISNLSQLFCALVFGAQVHAANIPQALQPDRRPTVRPSPIVDPTPITCTTSTINIGCGSMYIRFLILFLSQLLTLIYFLFFKTQ